MCPMYLCVTKKNVIKLKCVLSLNDKRGFIANIANKSPSFFAKIAIFANYFFANSLLNIKPTILRRVQLSEFAPPHAFREPFY